MRRRYLPRAKYALLTIAGLWLYQWGADLALAARGYHAYGGECTFLLLPALYWLAERTAQDWAYAKEAMQEEGGEDA